MIPIPVNSPITNAITEITYEAYTLGFVRDKSCLTFRPTVNTDLVHYEVLSVVYAVVFRSIIYTNLRELLN